jgi:DNA-binding transcriptional LysR family regulator
VAFEFSRSILRDNRSVVPNDAKARFARLSHAFIAPRGRPGGIVDQHLEQLGLKRRVTLMIPQFLLAPFVIAETDLVLTLPERVAHAFMNQLPLEIVEPPLGLAAFPMLLLWHDKDHDDPAHQFLRRLIVEVMSDERAKRGS